MTNRFVDHGVDNEVADDLDQEVDTDKGGDQKDEQVFIACGFLKQIRKEDIGADDEDTRIDEGYRYRRNDGADKVVLFRDQFMEKPGQEPGERSLKETDENGRRGAERNKSESGRRKNSDKSVDESERKPHPRAVETSADNDGKEGEVHIDRPELDVIGDETERNFQCDKQSDAGYFSCVEFDRFFH